ncbi:MAG TPA: hypothetical protein ENH41_01545 [Candidatus Omnitrophica bacterium]|nr:hypothetical protein [Candidatus Omnitrophota bacterium]
MLKLLIKKGLISQKEVDGLRAEIEKKAEPTPKGLEARVTNLEKKQKEVPSWIKDFKFKGDLRLRNEAESNAPGKDNNRQRLRFRVGATTKVNDQVKLGFGLATGGSSITSTNQTLDDSFSTKNFDLDYAYVKYEPRDWLYLIGGKFKSPFFHTDMLWDSDIRFEGAVVKLTHKLNSFEANPTKVFLAGGYFPLENLSSTARDPHLFIAQAGTETKIKDWDAKLKTGLAFYNFKSVEGTVLSTLPSTNTTVGTNLRYDYRIISPALKFSSSNIFGIIDIPAGLLAEFAENTAVSRSNEAWRVGAWLGKSKVKKKGQWRLLGQYSRLAADAMVDVFPDGDFNDAKTNAKGWELIFDYGLADNLTFSVDYYNTEVITGNKSDDQIIQTDLIFKF